MGLVEQKNCASNNSENSNISKKIPEYAKDFKKEWLYITGINRKCGDFIKKIDFNSNSFKEVFFTSKPKALISHFKNVLEGQKMGKLQNISDFYFKYIDISNVECLEEQLDNYRDLYVDPNSYQFDEESYELNIDIDFPGFRELFNLICLFNDKIKKEEHIVNIFDSDSESERSERSESESESESDDDF